MVNIRLSSRKIFQGRIINLRLDEVQLPDGRRASREIVEHPGAAAIVPVDGDGNLRLVRQYRDAAAEEMLEIPAGKLKAGEDPRHCALRELEEETGLTAGRLTHLATFFSTPGFCDEAMHLYLARDLSPGTGNPDREEFVEPATRPLEPVSKLLGELKDGKSLVGVLLAHRLINTDF